MRRIWLVIIVVVTLISCEKTISEFQSLNFVKFFCLGSESNGFDVKELPNGYIVAGSNSTAMFKKQVFVVRTDKAGNTLWSNQFGTAQNEEGRIVKPVGDGFYALGVSTNDITGLKQSFLIALSGQGDSLSTHYFGDATYSLVINDLLIQETCYYVAGESYQNSPSEPDYFIAKYDHSGNVIWQRTLAGSGSQVFNKLFIKGNDGILVVGTSNGVINSPYKQIAIVEFSTTGLPINFKEPDAQANQHFGDALFDGENLTIAYNVESGSSTTACIMCLSTMDYSTEWKASSGLGNEAKALAKSSEGTISLFGIKSNTIYLYQINNSGTITLTSDKVKTLAGSVTAAISTNDNGWALIGTTAPDYGSLMQLIKTDEELFLFEL